MLELAGRQNEEEHKRILFEEWSLLERTWKAKTGARLYQNLLDDLVREAERLKAKGACKRPGENAQTGGPAVAGPGTLTLTPPQAKPATSTPFGVNGGRDDYSWTTTSGKWVSIRTPGSPYPNAQTEVKWEFSGIPDALTPGQTFTIKATGTCSITPDPSYAAGVISSPWLETAGLEVLTHKGAGVGNSPSRGKFIASETAEWKIRVPAGTTSARIGIGADLGIGQIAAYNYKAKP